MIVDGTCVDDETLVAFVGTCGGVNANAADNVISIRRKERNDIIVVLIFKWVRSCLSDSVAFVYAMLFFNFSGILLKALNVLGMKE